MNDSSNRYYVKNTENGSYQDITTLFNGVAILKAEGFLSKGEPVNVFTQQWVNSQTEDFLITTVDGNNNPVVIRKNVDLQLTFIVRQKYVTGSTVIDVQTVHDTFVAYMTGKDIWLKSDYMGGKAVHCVCLSEYKPTTLKLGRGNDSYAIGTITLHCLTQAA